jgi:hypothetical protein
MKKILFTLFLVLALSVLLSADFYIKSSEHTDAFANQPAQDMVLEKWLGNNQLFIKIGDKIIIMDMKKNVMFIVNSAEKSYIETALPLDISKLLPKEIVPMLALLKMTAKVTPNGQTQKVSKWDCTGYDLEMSMMMGQFQIKVWATTDVPFDWKLFAKMYANVFKIFSMDDASIAEYQKIKGFQVAEERTMNMRGNSIKTTTQVLEITKKDAPAGLYEVPPGFSKKDMLSMQDLSGGI